VAFERIGLIVEQLELPKVLEKLPDVTFADGPSDDGLEGISHFIERLALLQQFQKTPIFRAKRIAVPRSPVEQQSATRVAGNDLHF